MICGTASDVGKSHVVTGLCRVLARRGVKVAPFKAQNMALNSFVTPSGYEIGRAQGVQALAARAVPEVAMNPILLKPTGERTSQVVVLGRPVGHLEAAEYHARKPQLFGAVLDALGDLRSRYDVVICEGAGSAAEINLLDHDLVNLRLASAAGVPALVVGDIDRGGVFAALYGTVALLPPEYRPLIRGFVINKFRGDPALLGSACADLEQRCGVATLGVLPWIHDVALDAEDSLALSGRRPRPAPSGDQAPVTGDSLDVAVVRLPRLSNFTDLDALAIEPGVSVRFVEDAGALGDPDLIILPGSKATVADLSWVRARGLDAAMARAAEKQTAVLGICGGYQMLGRTIEDQVESAVGVVRGLGWLAVDTVFHAAKITRQRRGASNEPDRPRVEGYEIHHGVVDAGESEGEKAARTWILLDDAHGVEVAGVETGGVYGTSLHGIFEADAFRGAFLAAVASRRGKSFRPSSVSFPAAREAQFDRLADLLEAHLDLVVVEKLIA
jgi:adenosylcobyric acid synthase